VIHRVLLVVGDGVKMVVIMFCCPASPREERGCGLHFFNTTSSGSFLIFSLSLHASWLVARKAREDGTNGRCFALSSYPVSSV